MTRLERALVLITLTVAIYSIGAKQATADDRSTDRIVRALEKIADNVKCH